MPNLHHIARRTFVKQTSVAVVGAAFFSKSKICAAETSTHRQATGVRIGEVTDNSAIIWTRLTSAPTRRIVETPDSPEDKATAKLIEGACPGAPGQVRLRYGTHPELKRAAATDWMKVDANTDFIHQFALSGLKAGTVYYFAGETKGEDGKTNGELRGEFQTAPLAKTPSNLTFCVMTCQGYPDRGHPDGHAIYPAMLALKPNFTCLTGDLVYYDNDAPKATSPDLAHLHWERMFSLPRLIEFNRRVATYWLKDDHDTLNNDCWPTEQMGTFTFAEGQRIFRQQAPMADGPSYRTFRWGRDLQIWLTDGRDFRSPNNMPDGPEKTIWGKEQKAWFQRTVKESDATWKVLISPTPLVGPDRKGKNDNHTNSGFKHEGDELRAWLKAHVPENFFVICGDRHWQYHSMHPETGLREFSVGPASNEHSGGTPGVDPAYHRFHRVRGGFLSTTLKRTGNKSAILVQHRDVNGVVVHEWSAERKLPA